jgi:hypothetical protein
MKKETMRISTALQAVCVLVLFLAGAAMAQAPTFEPVATVLQIMQGIVAPNSDVVFKVATAAPKDDKEWAAVQNSAVTLAEAGNLLLIPGRAAVLRELIDSDFKKGNSEWVKDAKALTAASAKAFNAANAKDRKALAMIGDQVEVTCENCHARYHPSDDTPSPLPKK